MNVNKTSEFKYLSLVDDLNGDIISVLKVESGLSPSKTNKSIIEKVLKSTLEHYSFEDHELVFVDKFDAHSDSYFSVVVQAEEFAGDLNSSSRCFLALREVFVY